MSSSIKGSPSRDGFQDDPSTPKLALERIQDPLKRKFWI